MANDQPYSASYDIQEIDLAQLPSAALHLSGKREQGKRGMRDRRLTTNCALSAKGRIFIVHNLSDFNNGSQCAKMEKRIGRAPAGRRPPARQRPSQRRPFSTARLTIGLDAEWVQAAPERNTILSFQLWLLELGIGLLVLPRAGERLTLSELVTLALRVALGQGAAPDCLTMVSHFSRAEVQATAGWRDDPLVRRLVTVQRTFTSSKSILLGYRHPVQRRVQALSFTFRDTWLLSGDSALEKLGEAISIPKVFIAPWDKSRMDLMLAENFDLFVRYAMQDAVIAAAWHARFLDWARTLCGREVQPVTASGLAEACVLRRTTEHTRDLFGYEGYKEIRHEGGKLVYKTSLRLRESVQRCAPAFHGGRNETFLFGYWPGPWYDYDLANAYPTAMLCLQDLDWSIFEAFSDPAVLSWNDVGYARVIYEFHEGDVPAFAMDTEYGLVFPRRGETVVTLPELWMAYHNRMLSRCRILEGFRFRRLGRCTLAGIVANLICARRKQPRGSLEDSMLKLLANCIYGKLAQGLRPKKAVALGRSLALGQIEQRDIGPSRISNPALAAFATGMVRALMGEELNYLQRIGAGVGAVTTDGFTTDRPLTDLELEGAGLPLSGMVSQVRRTWLGDPHILELKHRTDAGCVFITTRCYWMIPSAAPNKLLVARGGVQTDARGDDPAASAELSRIWLSSQKKYNKRHLSSLADALRGGMVDLINRETPTSIGFDYDLKRRPLDPADQPVSLAGHEAVKAIFRSVPWASAEEFLSARATRERFLRQAGHDLQTAVMIREFLDFHQARLIGDGRARTGRDALLGLVVRELLRMDVRQVDVARFLNIDAKSVRNRKRYLNKAVGLDRETFALVEPDLREICKRLDGGLYVRLLGAIIRDSGPVPSADYFIAAAACRQADAPYGHYLVEEDGS